MIIRPTKGNVYAVRPKIEEKKTESGIYIPHETVDRAEHDRVLIQAEVIAIGEDVSEVAVGDTILFPRYEAWPITASKSKDDDEFVVAEKFIFGKLSTG